MFKALQALLAACASITQTMALNSDGTITVTIIPKATKGGDGNASLNTPLCLTGTPEELDAEFVNILTSYTAKRTSLAEQLESTAAVLDAAKKDAAATATKAISKSTSSKTGGPGPKENGAKVDGEHDDDDENQAGSSTAEPVVAAATAVAPAKNLWD
jgi:PRTRC genetic system protein E